MKKIILAIMLTFGINVHAYTMEDCKAYLEEGIFVNQKLTEAIYRGDSNGVLKQMMQHSIDIGKETIEICNDKLDISTMNKINNDILKLEKSIKTL